MRYSKRKIDAGTLKIPAFLSIPAETFGFALEMKSKTEMVVRGCRAIARYSPRFVSLAIAGGYVNVCGSKLLCVAYSGSDVGIEGAFRCVFFSDALPNVR